MKKSTKQPTAPRTAPPRAANDACLADVRGGDRLVLFVVPPVVN